MLISKDFYGNLCSTTNSLLMGAQYALPSAGFVANDWNDLKKAVVYTKGTLGRIFAKVALNPLGQFVMRNAGRISAVSYFGGDILSGFSYVFPAATWVAGDIGLAVNDFAGKKRDEILPNWPISDSFRERIAKCAPHGKKFAGGISLIGTVALMHLSKNEPGHRELLASCSVMALQNLSMIFENQFHTLAAYIAKGENKLSQIFAPAAKYPVMTMNLIGMAAKVVMGYGAIKNGDLNMALGTAAWAVGGDGGVICMDDNVRRWVDRQKAAREQANSLQAPMIA